MPFDCDLPSAVARRKKLKDERRAANREKHAALQKKSDDSKKITSVYGKKQRIEEYKERLLAAPVAETMIRKLIEIAQDNEHPGQMAALKMAIDRIVPASVFEEKKDGARTAIQITISGIGENNNMKAIEGEVLSGD